MSQGCLEEPDGGHVAGEAGPVLAPLMRKGGPEPEVLLGALGQAHVEGIDVDWGVLLQASNAKRVDLPTYAFQSRRFWIAGGPGLGDLAAAGQVAADHPLLGASVTLADGGLVLTGRVSLQTHPWLADHAVLETVLLPGTAFVEIALRAATEAVDAGEDPAAAVGAVVAELARGLAR